MINFKKLFNTIAFSKNFLKATRFLYFAKTNPEPLVLNKDDKCLLFAPHPDDETFGCGGLLIKYPDNFHIICLTDGIHGSIDKNPDHEAIKQTRKKEFISAIEIAGVNSYEFIEIEDRNLIKNYDKFKNINLSGYNYIFIPYFMDNHKDHKATNVLLQKLLNDKGCHKNQKIAFYELWSALPQFNYYVDITPIKDKKKEMINCYKSQLKNLDYLEGLIGLNKYRGTCTSLGYAESYSVINIADFLKL